MGRASSDNVGRLPIWGKGAWAVRGGSLLIAWMARARWGCPFLIVGKHEGASSFPMGGELMIL